MNPYALDFGELNQGLSALGHALGLNRREQEQRDIIKQLMEASTAQQGQQAAYDQAADLAKNELPNTVISPSARGRTTSFSPIGEPVYGGIVIPTGAQGGTTTPSATGQAIQDASAGSPWENIKTTTPSHAEQTRQDAQNRALAAQFAAQKAQGDLTAANARYHEVLAGAAGQRGGLEAVKQFRELQRGQREDKQFAAVSQYRAGLKPEQRAAFDAGQLGSYWQAEANKRAEEKAAQEKAAAPGEMEETAAKTAHLQAQAGKEQEMGQYYRKSTGIGNSNPFNVFYRDALARGLTPEQALNEHQKLLAEGAGMQEAAKEKVRAPYKAATSAELARTAAALQVTGKQMTTAQAYAEAEREATAAYNPLFGNPPPNVLMKDFVDARAREILNQASKIPPPSAPPLQQPPAATQVTGKLPPTAQGKKGRLPEGYKLRGSH